MAVSLSFSWSNNLIIAVNSAASGYTKLADKDANNTEWGAPSGETQTSATTKVRYRYRTLITYGAIQYVFNFYANGYPKGSVNNGASTQVWGRQLSFDANDGKSYSVSVIVAPYSTVTKTEQRYVEMSTRKDTSSPWGSFTYVRTENTRGPYQDTSYQYPTSTTSRTMWTAPKRFVWSGTIRSGEVIEENLFHSDWVKLAQTAARKYDWKNQNQYGQTTYTVNTWIGKVVSAQDFNIMAGYCGSSRRVQQGELIYASYFIELSDAVNQGI